MVKPLEETHTRVFHEAEFFRAHVGLMGDGDDDDDDAAAADNDDDDDYNDDDDDDGDDDGTDDGTGPENAIQMLYNGNVGNENDHNDNDENNTITMTRRRWRIVG